MVVKWNEDGDLVYVDKKGNEIEIDVDSWYCGLSLCQNTHLQFSIPILGFQSGENSYFGELYYFDEFDQLNEEIEQHLVEWVSLQNPT